MTDSLRVRIGLSAVTGTDETLKGDDSEMLRQTLMAARNVVEAHWGDLGKNEQRAKVRELEAWLRKVGA